MSLEFNDKFAAPFLRENDLPGMRPFVAAAHEMLHNRSGAGRDFLGWLDLPVNYDREEFSRIQSAASEICENSDVLLVIGIGGSYLGARAAVEFLHSPLYNELPKKTPNIYFVGNGLSGTYLSEILRLCDGKRVSLNVISKSGTTTEPAIAFRVLREYLEKTVGKDEANRRIYVTTDRERGTLKRQADERGWKTFTVPDDVGGRYSVLSAVGLLPIAVSGADLNALMDGAAAARSEYSDADLFSNGCYRYAALRNIFYRKGKTVELVTAYEPRFTMFNEWYRQLFGESEGKDSKGIFPASAVFSTDLHSMGQYIQDGSRILFETVLQIKDAGDDITIERAGDDGDGLNFLAGRRMSYVNRKAFEGTVLAHSDGGVPNTVITVDRADEEHLGRLIYFFEKACAVSGYLLGVNPFDQPGVESYKKNMFAMLGKPGYESQREALEARLK